MNKNKIANMAKVGLVASGLGVFNSAHAELLTGLEYNNNIIFTMDSATPGNIFATGVSGLQGSDLLIGIDYLGTTLYGVGSAGNLYTINATSGAASLVNHFGTLNGTTYGMDASAAGIRIVSDNDINILLNSATGVIISSTPALNPSTLTINAIASAGGTMYAVDSLANTLGTLNTGTGAFSTIGSMGYDVSGKNGFDISSKTGIAYFASAVSSSGTDANLYTVDLSTGFASLVGVIGSGDGLLVTGLTTSVPEPATSALALLGGAGMLALIRRRK